MSDLSVFDHIFDTAIAVNQKGEIIYFNNQASVFFKLPPRLLKQKSHITQLCDSTDIDIQEWLNKALLSFEVLTSSEIRLQLAKDPETEYSVVLKLIPAGHNFVVLFQDKTVERGLHVKYRDQLEELKRTHHQILQADKLTTLGELTANISHEINNPLTIAAGHSEILRDFLSSPNIINKIPKAQKANQIVLESLERVNQIIRNMKDFLHLSEDQKEYCDINALLDSSIEWVQAAARKANVTIQRDVKGHRIVALANRIKLEQVLINLIKNSIDAIKEANIDGDNINVTISKSEQDAQTIIDIIDDGPGLPLEIKKNLFRPFHSTKEAGRGTGLGLSICARIIADHRGKLEHVESEKGCHFRVRLPLIEVYSYTRNDRSFSGSTKQKRILVLDNEVQILNVFNAFIQDEGLVFIGSSDPLDALDFLTKANVDLIITDFSMPEMNGSEFSAKARSNGYKGPILYMTSAKFIDQFNKDKNELAIGGVIIKPFNRDDVMRTVRSVLKLEGSTL